MPKPKAGDHFESLFEHAPISLWEQDYSGIKIFFDKLRANAPKVRPGASTSSGQALSPWTMSWEG